MSWASRIPYVRSDLHLGAGSLGLVLTAVAVGSTISVPLSGIVITRLGDARAVTVTSLLVAIGLGVVAATVQIGAVPLALGLALMGLAPASGTSRSMCSARPSSVVWSVPCCPGFTPGRAWARPWVPPSAL